MGLIVAGGVCAFCGIWRGELSELSPLWGKLREALYLARILYKTGALGVSYGGEYQKQGNRADLWKILGFTMAGAYDNEDSSMIPLFHTSPRLQLPASAHTGKGAFVNTRLVKRLQEKIAKDLLQADCGMQNRGFTFNGTSKVDVCIPRR